MCNCCRALGSCGQKLHPSLLLNLCILYERQHGAPVRTVSFCASAGRCLCFPLDIRTVSFCFSASWLAPQSKLLLPLFFFSSTSTDSVPLRCEPELVCSPLNYLAGHLVTVKRTVTNIAPREDLYQGVSLRFFHLIFCCVFQW